jgi:enoyl-CoA hydratase/carnithine racemase
MNLARGIASNSPVAVQGTKLAMNYARSHGIEVFLIKYLRKSL